MAFLPEMQVNARQGVFFLPRFRQGFQCPNQIGCIVDMAVEIHVPAFCRPFPDFRLKTFYVHPDGGDHLAAGRLRELADVFVQGNGAPAADVDDGPETACRDNAVPLRIPDFQIAARLKRGGLGCAGAELHNLFPGRAASDGHVQAHLHPGQPAGHDEIIAESQGGGVCLRYFLKPVQNRFRLHEAVRPALITADGGLRGKGPSGFNMFHNHSCYLALTAGASQKRVIKP